MNVEEAVLTRRSVRAFLPTPVPVETIRSILAAAARAPSGTNMQPWKVWVLTGAARDRLVQATLARGGPDIGDEDKPEYKYYPDTFPEPYLSRRRKTGWGLYNLLGIKKGDTQRMWDQHERNFVFFGAPVGMIFTIDRVLEIGSWLDYGMFLENICLLARDHGLHTCPQAAWPRVHRVVRPMLNIPDDQMIVCGMALGYEDTTAPENALRTERELLETWVTMATS
ncbi:MAG: nitroreductase [Alphaproteobacteria bacterium]